MQWCLGAVRSGGWSAVRCVTPQLLLQPPGSESTVQEYGATASSGPWQWKSCQKPTTSVNANHSPEVGKHLTRQHSQDWWSSRTKSQGDKSRKSSVSSSILFIIQWINLCNTHISIELQNYIELYDFYQILIKNNECHTRKIKKSCNIPSVFEQLFQ